MGNIFLLFPPIMFSDIKDIRTKALAFEQVAVLDWRERLCLISSLLISRSLSFYFLLGWCSG
ncbi:hypothetical protein Patl1_35130 [Pistacia atlantica]|uniref:Uncharacterized protein n=1 Tax=Pistacia atlantica TaxID=434234 RepID=A0ACC0ZS14_9ROSI|nr:hypothetical protein Patl1_35130 [Pistacia atlantica]